MRVRVEARVSIEKEISTYGDRANEARREYQRSVETTEKARSELRSLLMTHLALLDRTEIVSAAQPESQVDAHAEIPAAVEGAPPNGSPSTAYVDV